MSNFSADGFRAAALLMREVLCERVYRRRHSWDAAHPCRTLGLRDIEPTQLLRYVQLDLLTMSPEGLRAEAARVLDLIEPPTRVTGPPLSTKPAVGAKVGWRGLTGTVRPDDRDIQEGRITVLWSDGFLGEPWWNELIDLSETT